MRFAFFVPAALTLAACNPSEPTFTAGQLPACDSPYTRHLLIKTIHESPQGQAGLKVADVGPIIDWRDAPLAKTPEALAAKKAYEEAKARGDYKGQPEPEEMNNCEGKVFTNAGERRALFHLKWMNAATKDRVWMQVNWANY